MPDGTTLNRSRTIWVCIVIFKVSTYERTYGCDSSENNWTWFCVWEPTNERASEQARKKEILQRKHYIEFISKAMRVQRIDLKTRRDDDRKVNLGIWRNSAKIGQDPIKNRFSRSLFGLCRTINDDFIIISRINSEFSTLHLRPTRALGCLFVPCDSL